MKSVFLITTIYLLYLTKGNNCKPSDHHVSQDKLKEAAMVVVNDCKAQVGASDDDIEALKMHKMPSSHEGLCMLECLFNTARLMKDGKINKEGALEFFSPEVHGSDEKLTKMRDMITVCEKEIGAVDDGCQTAKMIIECTIKHGKAFGFTFPNHLKQSA